MPIQAVITKGKVPIKIWDKIENVESGALDQLVNCANLPFVFKHIAVMPDVHWGMGATIGSVIATKGAICPAAVGVDIGCGMMAVKTDLDHKMVCDKLPELRKQIERAVPVGFDQNKKLNGSTTNWDGWLKWSGPDWHKWRELKLLGRAIYQLGSLGGGNHFIEVCLDDGTCDGCHGTGEIECGTAGLNGCPTCQTTGKVQPAVWVMLHSGSRGVGNVLARRHIDNAKGLMKQMLIGLPDPHLAYLPEETEQFREYWADLEWCQDYAAQNRREMMDRVLRQLSYMFREKETIPRLAEINCHHNYVARENHFNENVLVTRKGAVRAREGDMGIIPGSMGTRSYIVRGLGAPQSFMSCSHGAGRRMSRTVAKKTFTSDDFADQTAGVECRKDPGVLDEIPGAYKRIEDVMENQSDLVEIVATLKQVLCVKG